MKLKSSRTKRVFDYVLAFIAISVSLAVAQGLLYLFSPSNVLSFEFGLGLIIANTIFWGWFGKVIYENGL